MAAAALDRALAKHGSRLAGQREYPRAAQSARGGDRSHRTGAPFEPVRSVCLSLRLCYRCRSSRRAALRTSDRMGRPRLARPAAHGRSDAGQDRRQCPSRSARRGTRRTQSSACHRPQADHRRLSRRTITLWHQNFSNSTSPACTWPAYRRSEPPWSREPEAVTRPNRRLDRRLPNGRNRRVSPVAPRPREGPLTEPIAGAQPRPQERVLMPHTCRSAVWPGRLI